VTSVQAQSGSSLIAELLAWSASKSRKTLLIDLDYLAAQGCPRSIRSTKRLQPASQ
jgi:Mrp family chromosome partitioning ATPase